MGEHDRLPTAQLEDELRRGLHNGGDGDTPQRTGRISGVLRCWQAALLRLAAAIHEVDARLSSLIHDSNARRGVEVQRVHDRISALEARLHKLDDSAERRAAQRDLDELQQAIRDASHRIAALELQAAEARGRLEGSSGRPMTMAQVLDTLLKAGAVLVFALGSAWAFVELVIKSG